ncbi:hypothetical protein F5B19DRAFT_497915 [Rostrohypoxylon terebratum]|nr:hypothetical protein F5B19DRAFT_497915 [Rostrohypoxylon terebratum]
MADFSWLRLGQRSHVPNNPQSPTSPRHGLHRVPSYPSLTSPSSLSYDSLMGHDDANLLVREHDKIWYNPSLNQMVECLQVAIMAYVSYTRTRGTTQPIPIEYNSYILHLIEGFADAQERIRKVDVSRNEAKRSLELHLEHFKAVADEWLERERQYKTEIKRLEVLLSRTSRDGLEAVTLARANSVFDRSSPNPHTKQFVSRINRPNASNTRGMYTEPPFTGVLDPLGDLPGVSDKPGSEPSAKVLDITNDFLMSEKLRRQDAIAETILANSENGLPWHGTRESQKPISDTLTNPRLTHEERQSRRYILENLLGYETTHSSGKDIPPRKKVGKTSSMIRLSQAPKNQNIRSSDSKHSRGLSTTSVFSFVPGDDTSLSLVDSEVDKESTGAISANGEGGQGGDDSKGVTNSLQYRVVGRRSSVAKGHGQELSTGNENKMKYAVNETERISAQTNALLRKLARHRCQIKITMKRSYKVSIRCQSLGL